MGIRADGTAGIRHVAFLRGVSPLNATMSDLRRAFERAGFANVRTILASGNVAFDARSGSEGSLERRAQTAMREVMGREFYTIVRSRAYLVDLLDADPFAALAVPAGAKRVVSFLRDATTPRVSLPYAQDGARVLCLRGREALTAYVASDKGPVFMKLIERAFGADVTTRTWDTVRKCALA